MTHLSTIPNAFPIFRIITLDWPYPKLEWSFESTLLLHAVLVSTSVDLDFLCMYVGASLCESSDPYRRLKVAEELNVRSTLLTLLQLSYSISGLRLVMEIL